MFNPATYKRLLNESPASTGSFSFEHYKLISNSNDYVIITNCSDNIIWVNEGFTNKTGYTLKEVIGKRPSSFLRGNQTSPEDGSRIDNKASLRIPFKEQVLNYKKDGNPIWLSLSVIPIFNNVEEFEGYICIGSDISDLKQNEELLLQQSKRLKVINGLLEAMVSSQTYEDIFRSLTKSLVQAGLALNQLHAVVCEKDNNIVAGFSLDSVGNPMLAGDLLYDENITVSLLHCLKKEKTTYLKDIIRVKSSKLPLKFFETNGQHSVLVIALPTDDNITGYLILCSERIDAFSESDLSLINEIRNTLSVTIRQAELKRKLHEKNEQIDEKNHEITDSILYAKRIQEALLPEKKRTNKLLPNSFFLYQPKDIVSGDFYWIAERHDKVYFTAADCTGHGVPGAFMSMIGSSLLNQIVLGKKISSANEILTELRRKVINTLRQNQPGSDQKDGMDISFCVWDKMKYTLEFSGANNPMLLIRRNTTPLIDLFGDLIPFDTDASTPELKLYEFKADRQPIGISGTTLKPFHNHEFKLYSGDTIYLFTDGITDQFGGEKRKKFMIKRLKKLLISIQHLELKEQEKFLRKFISNWRNGLDQVDDILIIGARF